MLDPRARSQVDVVQKVMDFSAVDAIKHDVAVKTINVQPSC